jgi:hypothetical protein
MKIRHMRIACWIPIPTNIHSGYVILIAFPLQQRLHECVSMLRYAHMHVVCYNSEQHLFVPFEMFNCYFTLNYFMIQRTELLVNLTG